MPKFLSYQRPTPVNKQNWSGRAGHAYGPVRTPKAAVEAPKLKLPPLPPKGDGKPH